MSSRTVLLIKQSRLFTQTSPRLQKCPKTLFAWQRRCIIDLQYQYIQKETVRYFLIKQPFVLQKNTFNPLTVAHYSRPDYFFKIFGWPVKSLTDLQSTFYITQLDFFFLKKIKIKQLLKNNICTHNVIPPSLFMCYPAREIKIIISRPIVTQSHAPSCTSSGPFCPSKKKAHACEPQTHTHTHTRTHAHHTLALSCHLSFAYTHTHTHTHTLSHKHTLAWR